MEYLVDKCEGMESSGSGSWFRVSDDVGSLWIIKNENFFKILVSCI